MEPDDMTKEECEAPLEASINRLKELVFSQREALLGCGNTILPCRFHIGLEGVPVSAKGEAMENIMLAYRHIEDARMRLGKVIQAIDGGTSCYPR